MVEQSGLMQQLKGIELTIKVEEDSGSILDKEEIEEVLEKTQLLTLVKMTKMPRRGLFQAMLARKLCYDIHSFIIFK